LLRKALFEHPIHPCFDICMYLFPFTCQSYYKCIIFHLICVAGADPVAYPVTQLKLHKHADDALPVVRMDFCGNLRIDLLQAVMQNTSTQLFERFRQFTLLPVILFIKFIAMDQGTDIMTRAADDEWYAVVLMDFINNLCDMLLELLDRKGGLRFYDINHMM